MKNKLIEMDVSDKRIDGLLESGKKYFSRLAVMVVSTAYHAAKEGDVRPLNRLYMGLPSKGQKDEVRVYMGVLSPAEHRWLTFSSKDGFKVKPDTGEVRSKVAAALAEDEYPAFGTKKVAGTAEPFNDDALTKRLASVIAAMERDTSVVSDAAYREVKVLLEKAIKSVAKNKNTGGPAPSETRNRNAVASHLTLVPTGPETTNH